VGARRSHERIGVVVEPGELRAVQPGVVHELELPRDVPVQAHEVESNGPATFLTEDTHWRDGSQIYGGDAAFADAFRTHVHGKLRLDDTALPQVELEEHIDLTGVAGNFWVGLALLHSLFMREHNAMRQPARAAPRARRSGSLRG
jgi:hypothetical protein